MHPRTLQRRLQEEGTTFEEIKDEARRDLAERYLSQPRRTPDSGHRPTRLQRAVRLRSQLSPLVPHQSARVPQPTLIRDSSSGHVMTGPNTGLPNVSSALPFTRIARSPTAAPSPGATKLARGLEHFPVTGHRIPSSPCRTTRGPGQPSEVAATGSSTPTTRTGVPPTAPSLRCDSGWRREGDGRWYAVDACAQHASQLLDRPRPPPRKTAGQRDRWIAL